MAAKVRATERCRSCLTADERDKVNEAVKRQHLLLDSFFAGEAEQAHRDPDESTLEKAHRLGSAALGGAADLLGWIPGLGAVTKNTIVVLSKVVKYGPLALYSNDIVETVQLLAVMASRSRLTQGSDGEHKETAEEKEEAAPVRGTASAAAGAVRDAGTATLEATEMSIGLYYLLLEQRNSAALDPEATVREHAGCEKVETATLEELNDLLTLAITAYAASAAEAQRMLRLMPGSWRLICLEFQGPGGQPPFILAADQQAKRAAVLVPGTQTPTDCVTDLKALPVHLRVDSGRDIGWVHRGMLRQACAIVRLAGSALERLEREGYEVLFCGHSLGAGVAAIAGAVCRLGLEGARLSKVRSLCYATPAVGNGSFGQYCQPHCTTVINCDDMVPRLSIETARKLYSELIERKDAVRVYLKQDIDALKDVRNLTEKKTRTGSSSLVSAASSERAAQEGAKAAQELVDLGIPAPTPGTEAQVLAASKASTMKPSAAKLQPAAPGEISAVVEAKPADKPKARKKGGFFFCCSSAQQDSDHEQPQSMVKALVAEPEEPPEPVETDPADVRLVPPGRLIHLARHCGARRAWWIRRSHPSLHRINVHHGVGQDHICDTYREALNEALALSRGGQPKSWKAVNEVSACACCNANFEWSSVLRSEPHILAMRHHCYQCGEVVCAGCSERRRPLPQVGVLRSVRVCDRCFLRPS
eukprot:TRINITY_DN22007_c0_g1_i1.p1 TRINITY_DN22007_c0_g1~~TRINITY_DN22007_c0_g1_i1.p1  ORF type:complete len:792 (-),score=143.87 TRINITY_DN22007_c0_g1_i1:38-2146(-)